MASWEDGPYNTARRNNYRKKKRNSQFPPLPPLSEPASYAASTDHDVSTTGRSAGETKFSVEEHDLDLGEEDEDIMSPSVNPSTLCPFCDRPLPEAPTTELLELIRVARGQSYPDVRPTNPLGRRAPMLLFSAVCHRHDFETRLLPRGKKEGWPEKIDWGRMKSRIIKMHAPLLELLADPGTPLDEIVEGETDSNGDAEGSSAEDRDEDEGLGNSKGPRDRCVFWRDVKKQIMQQGSRAVTGAMGQLSLFSNIQPGYYGERGATIIYQMLVNLFPPTSMNPELTRPLTPADFVRLVLTPEVALNLIMEDMGCGRRTALKTLRDSSVYGVAMFPEIDGDDDDDVGQAIVKERARKRRQELADEDQGSIDKDEPVKSKQRVQ
ncbi:hypothetical protein PLICRDRAFT_698840 [Plicaturopsis crispa FD-325 SS-3]|nr:hypothetical protein PLICRDRAFT_698840 [Plicaturopsis crispa FD-325 SS-3]